MFFGLDGLDTANKSGRHRAARQTTKEILVATQKFTGVIPPVVVPDTEDHQLDVASFAEFKTKPVQPLPGLKTFKKPESTIEEQEIKIPQFFQKNR